MKILYVAGGANGPYKIGVSEKPNDRMKSIQTGHPTPLHIVATADAPNSYTDEKRVHAILVNHRLNGEWFHCGVGVILAAMRSVGLSPEVHLQETKAANISAAAFRSWLTEMSKRPFYSDPRSCAEKLGVSYETVMDWAANGSDARTALACRALLHRLVPYGSMNA